MNKNILEGKWEQFKGAAQEAWGKITDDDLEKAKGSATKLKGLLQEKMGYTEKEAEKAYNSVMDKFSEGAEDLKEEASKLFDKIKK